MQNKRLFIVGANGYGREIADWIEESPFLKGDLRFSGFIDDNTSAFMGITSDYQIVGRIDDYRFRDNDYCILSIDEPEAKEKAYEKLKSKVSFFTFIHPSSLIGKNVEIGEGTIIYPNSVISTNCKIGNFVLMGCGNHIGFDSEIGDFSSLMASVDIGGQVKIGQKVYIGTKATIFPGKRIIGESIIGSGSVIIHNITSASSYFGNPAQRI